MSAKRNWNKFLRSLHWGIEKSPNIRQKSLIKWREKRESFCRVCVGGDTPLMLLKFHCNRFMWVKETFSFIPLPVARLTSERLSLRLRMTGAEVRSCYCSHDVDIANKLECRVNIKRKTLFAHLITRCHCVGFQRPRLALETHKRCNVNVEQI